MINVDEEISLAYLLDPAFQLVNTAGKPLTDGWLEVYIHGTRNKYYCYKDWDKEFLHPFKIPLDSLGSNIVLASPAHAYDIYVYNKFGSLIMSRYNIVPVTGDGTVIKDVVNIKSEDGTVTVRSSDQTNWDLSIKDTVDKVNQNTQDISGVKVELSNHKEELDSLTVTVNNHTTQIGRIQEDIVGIESAVAKKKDKQTELTFDGSATKTVKKITQYPNGELNVEFADIDLPQEVPNVDITSEDSSVNITTSVDAETNTKTFDLSVNVEDAPTFGRFVANNGLTLTKTEGNMTLSSDGKIQLKKGKGYHFTIRGNYYNDTLYNDLRDISFIEYSRNETIPIIVDGTLSTSQAQPFEISFDVAQRTSDLNYGIAFSGLTSNGHITGLRVEVHDINSVTVSGGGGGSGSGDNDKVAVDANAEPGYLENVLVSDSDIVTLVKLGNVLHVQVNTASTADPKLSTCDEAVINGATNNYGSYALANGYDKLVWDDPSSYSWLNAPVIQMKRLCTSQGTVTKCNIAICGTLSLTSPPAFINCGIFNTNGTLLGSTGLRLYGTDFFSGSELVSFDMTEVNTGDLNLKNNTYYIIQIITCGLQLAALSHKDSYNYTYDHDLRMNIEGTTSKLAWSNINDSTSRAAQIPWISFAASPSV